MANGIHVLRGMNDSDLDLLSESILEQFSLLNLAQIRVCFIKGKRGEYGAIYERLDVAVVLGWLTLFSEETMREVENRNYNNHLQNKA